MTTPDTTTAAPGPETASYDVAIVGAGYVGVPLAQVFAQAGRSVVLVDDDPDALVEAVRVARFPTEAPPLYGDGNAAGRIAAALRAL